MGLGVIYLLAGAGVAAAVALAPGGGARSRGERIFRVVAALFFWPLFVPLLLLDRPQAGPAKKEPVAPADELADAIARADAELGAALASLKGWAENVLQREGGRVEELRAAWKAQAERIREMDSLLTRPEPPPLAAGAEVGERVLQLERARRINRARLGQMRKQAFEDLLANLAWVRELASMIHVAKFSGAPAARAEELVARLAAAVEGIALFPPRQSVE